MICDSARAGWRSEGLRTSEGFGSECRRHGQKVAGCGSRLGGRNARFWRTEHASALEGRQRPSILASRIDTQGNLIAAHEGELSRFDGVFYWYGSSYANNPKGKLWSLCWAWSKRVANPLSILGRRPGEWGAIWRVGL